MIAELILTIENEEQRSVVEFIYENLYGLMYQKTYDILHNHHDTEDAIMETFERIVNNADKFLVRERKYITGLVMIYTLNVAKTVYVNRKKKDLSTVSLTTYTEEDSFDTKQMEIPDEDENLDRIVVNNETIKMMAAALRKLPIEQSAPVLLKHYYGFRYAEIGRQLGITENAARARVFRAREKLRELLGDEAYERLEF